MGGAGGREEGVIIYTFLSWMTVVLRRWGMGGGGDHCVTPDLGTKHMGVGLG